MSGEPDRWIRATTTGYVGLLALIAGTVSYLHMHTLVGLHGQPGWVAALTPLSVDGMIVAASTTLLADSRAGGAWRGAVLDAPGGGQRGEPGRQRRRRPADGGRAGHRSVALVRAYRRLRTGHAPGPPRCGRPRSAAGHQAAITGFKESGWCRWRSPSCSTPSG